MIFKFLKAAIAAVIASSVLIAPAVAATNLCKVVDGIKRMGLYKETKIAAVHYGSKPRTLIVWYKQKDREGG